MLGQEKKQLDDNIVCMSLTAFSTAIPFSVLKVSDRTSGLYFSTFSSGGQTEALQYKKLSKTVDEYN